MPIEATGRAINPGRSLIGYSLADKNGQPVTPEFTNRAMKANISQMGGRDSGDMKLELYVDAPCDMTSSGKDGSSRANRYFMAGKRVDAEDNETLETKTIVQEDDRSFGIGHSVYVDAGLNMADPLVGGEYVLDASVSTMRKQSSITNAMESSYNKCSSNLGSCYKLKGGFSLDSELDKRTTWKSVDATNVDWTFDCADPRNANLNSTEKKCGSDWRTGGQFSSLDGNMKCFMQWYSELD
jgi:hypothetical protein